MPPKILSFLTRAKTKRERHKDECLSTVNQYSGEHSNSTPSTNRWTYTSRIVHARQPSSWNVVQSFLPFGTADAVYLPRRHSPIQSDSAQRSHARQTAPRPRPRAAEFNRELPNDDDGGHPYAVTDINLPPTTYATQDQEHSQQKQTTQATSDEEHPSSQNKQSASSERGSEEIYLDPVDVLQAFFNDGHPSARDEGHHSAIRGRCETPQAAAIQLHHRGQPSIALSSVASSTRFTLLQIPLRLRRNSGQSARSLKWSLKGRQDSPTLPIHKRPLPPIPPALEGLTSREYSQDPPVVDQAERKTKHCPPTAQDQGSEDDIDSLSIRPTSLAAYIIPPEERARIGSAHRRSKTSRSSDSTDGSSESSHICPPLTPGTPLPASPFSGVFKSHTSLQPPPRHKRTSGRKHDTNT